MPARDPSLIIRNQSLEHVRLSDLEPRFSAMKAAQWIEYAF
jgi:hypothetical protein